MKCFNFVFIIFFLVGCSSWKEALVKDGGRSEAIHNAIVDFVHTSKLCKRDKVFNVYVEDIDNEIMKVIIIGATNKLYPRSDNKIGTKHDNSFPTQYTVLNGKLFYWYDKKYVITPQLIQILSQYNQIDSLNVNGFIQIPDLVIDDAKKGVLYYFCKNDISKYKKITTNRFMDERTFTKLKCKFPQNK